MNKKEEIHEMLSNWEVFERKCIHGSAKLKKDILDNDGDIMVSSGTIGAITAYLPKDETGGGEAFAVFFPGKNIKTGANNWFTWHDEATFLDMCEVALKPEEEYHEKGEVNNE